MGSGLPGVGSHLRGCPHPMSGAPPPQFSESYAQRGAGEPGPSPGPQPQPEEWQQRLDEGSAGLSLTSPQPRGQTDRPTLTQPAPPLRAGPSPWAPPCLPLPAALPPNAHLLPEKPQRRYHFEPRILRTGGEAISHGWAGRGAQTGRDPKGERRDGGGAHRAAEAPRPAPPGCVSGPLHYTTLSPTGSSIPALRGPSAIPGPQRGAPGALTWLGSQPREGTSSQRVSVPWRQRGRVEGAGAGARVGRRGGDLRAITRSGSRAHLAAGVSRPLQSLGSEAVVEGTQGPSLFLGLHEREVRGGIWGLS